MASNHEKDEGADERGLGVGERERQVLDVYQLEGSGRPRGLAGLACWCEPRKRGRELGSSGLGVQKREGERIRG